MKHKIKILGVIMLICMLFIVACGRPDSGAATDGGGEDAGSSYEGEESGESGDGGEVHGDNYEGPEYPLEDLPEGSLDGEDDEECQDTTIVLYHSNAEGDGLTSTAGVIVESITPENVLQVLIDSGELSSDVRILSFNQEGGRIELDLSSEFDAFIGTMGSSGEYTVLGSLVNTFLSAFGAESILITVGGGVLVTPHAGEMAEPMRRF